VTEELHKLGDVLRAAREAKGVDLPRVERDTKIRSRYLTALEAGDYGGLPGPVYTKGFLRNYGLYLGLDPEYLTDLYRLETVGGAVERRAPAPERPITVRRPRALVVTPAAVGWAVLTVAVAAFVAYLGYEFVTFARTPDLRVSDPATNLASYGQTEYTIRGSTAPNSTITVDGLRENPTVHADGQGSFSFLARLVPGSNVITLVANDPVTGRNSAQKTVMINVDLGLASPTPGLATKLQQPAAGAIVAGAVAVTGSAPGGTSVTVTARLVTAGKPGFSIRTLAGDAITVPAARPGQTVVSRLTAGTDGTFFGSLVLAPGSWDISVGTGEAPHRVTVTSAAGLTGSLLVSGGRSYLLVLQDGTPLSGVSGRTVQSGRTIALKATATLVVRAGNAGVVTLTVNGVKIGLMGAPGAVIEWHITAG
jgi:cytoskeletal protein RodZ